MEIGHSEPGRPLTDGCLNCPRLSPSWRLPGKEQGRPLSPLKGNSNGCVTPLGRRAARREAVCCRAFRKQRKPTVTGLSPSECSLTVLQRGMAQQVEVLGGKLMTRVQLLESTRWRTGACNALWPPHTAVAGVHQLIKPTLSSPLCCMCLGWILSLAPLGPGGWGERVPLLP